MKKYILVLSILCISISIGFAQDVRTSMFITECGSIVEGNFSSSYEAHGYQIDLNAGDSISTNVVPFGQGLETRISFFNPADQRIAYTDASLADRISTEVAPKLETSSLAANGQYTIYITNYNTNYGNVRGSGGIGVYTLYIGCTLRDGTIIEPGDTLETPTPTSEPTVQPSPQITIDDSNFIGFPGLPPVDFTNGVTIPLTLDNPNAGSISAGFEGIFGYSFSAEAGQTMSLDFTRTDGNLNLGVVLLSADNQVAFQASLVTSNTLSTELTIPASGEYTLGVFRIELIPPDAPENTTFTLTASLN